jgi:hypothetical protein
MLESKGGFGVRYGADVTCGPGVAAVDGGNNFNYTFNEINGEGAVTQDAEGRYHRLTIADFGAKGVEVLRGVNDTPLLSPGKSLIVKLGSHELTIVGTATPGVTLNGEAPEKITDELGDLRYPSPKR